MSQKPQLRQPVDEDEASERDGDEAEIQQEAPVAASAGAAVARKANGASMGDAAAAGMAGAGEKVAEADQAQAVDPRVAAEAGFAGAPIALPHRAAMERSFGVSFAGVRAYTDEHARGAAAKIGAHAYTVGNQIAFADPNPSKELVAHELTHVLQQGGHKAAGKSDGGAANGIEVAGEAEAEGVESAVASGKPAKGALAGDASAAKGDVGAPKEGAVANVISNKAVARSATAFGTGMTFSTTSLEKNYSYELWSPAAPIEIPIVAVPGLNFMVEPSVKVTAAGGVDWKDKKISTQLGVDGGVGVGFSYGNAKVCSVYSSMEASAFGGLKYERSQGKTPAQNTWSLDGGISLSTNFAVGVKLGGVVDFKFQFGKCDIGRLSGLHWENGRFDRNKLGWTWGAGPQAFFAKMRQLIAEAKRVMGLPKRAMKKAWKGVAKTARGMGAIIKKIDLTPWDGWLPFV